jgi:D-hydroxyproline dehydrogenase subunit gamma
MRRLEEEGTGAGAVIRFTFEGREVEAREGDSVAAALIAAGIGPIRSSAVSGEPRAPYCMMGVCFECLVEIDGLANRQACMVRVRPGMHVAPGSMPDA